MGEIANDNDTQTNITALDFAVRSLPGSVDDEIVDAAVKFRHFIMTGKVLIPPQPEQPA